MSFLVTTGRLATSVNNNGTFTVPYPTSTVAASYEPLGLHSLSCNGATYTRADNKIAVSFGASNITVTNQLGRTLDAGTEFWLQLDTITDVSPSDEINVFKNGVRTPAKVSEVTQDVTIAGNIVGNLSVSGSSTLNGTITAPNATSTLGNQIANVGTLDARYFGQVQKDYAPVQTIDTLGGWVQIAQFTVSGYRTLGELNCFIGTDNNRHASFRLALNLDSYFDVATPNGVVLPNCLGFRQAGAGFPFTAARIRMGVEQVDSTRATYLDLQFDPSTSGINTYIHSSASVLVPSLAFDFANVTAVVNPDTTGNVIFPNFNFATGAIVKSDAGDFTSGKEGQQVINTVDNTLKIFADGAWRTITTW
jgi:hypothetical protein